MKKITIVLVIFFICISGLLKAQQVNISDLTKQQNIIANCNQSISDCNAQITVSTAKEAVDNAAIAAYNAANAQTAAGVNWDYFVSLEQVGIRYTTWSSVATGVNWTTIIPSLGITCGSVSEAGVNWTNWGHCETNGMNPGISFGGYNTGIAAFWCGNGAISGTC